MNTNQSALKQTLVIAAGVFLGLAAWQSVMSLVTRANTAAALEAQAKKVCQINMQTIANAVQAYKVRTRAAVYPDIPDVSKQVGPGALLKDLDEAPTCPGSPSNHYSVRMLGDGFGVYCSDASHGKWENGALYP